MDPVSASASILTLLGFAGNSCGFIFNFFRSFSDAPANIRSQCASIQSLQTTFVDLGTLYADLPASYQLSRGLAKKTTKFLSKTREVERKILLSNAMVSRGAIHRTWARLKWSLAADRWLKQFFEDLEFWNVIFSHEVAAVQIKLLLKLVASNPSTNSASRPVIISDQANHQGVHHPKDPESLLLIHASKPCTGDEPGHTLSGLGGTNSKPLMSTRLSKFIQDVADPIELRPWLWHQSDGKRLFFELRCGPAIVRRWSPDGREVFKTLSSLESHSLAFTFQVDWILSGRISFMIFGLNQPRNLSSLSIQWNMKLSRLVPKYASSFDFVREGDCRALQMCLDLGKATVSDVIPSGDTLLHIAVSENRITMVSMLLFKGADANAINNLGEYASSLESCEGKYLKSGNRTPLHTAVKKSSNYEISRILVENGADTDRQNIDGRTPLHCFFSSVTQNLLTSHATDIDKAIIDDRGMTILHYTAWTSRSTRRDIDRCLRGSHVYSLTKDSIGRSVLHLAAQRGNLDLIHYFLGPSFSTALQIPDCLGRTLMHYATESSRIEALNILFQHGFDIRAVDHAGRSVLHHAAARGNLEAAKQVIQLGAKFDLLALDHNHRTPCELASACGAVSVAHYLQSLCNADPCNDTDAIPVLDNAETGLRLHSILAFCIPVGLQSQLNLLVLIGLLIWYITRHSFFL